VPAAAKIAAGAIVGITLVVVALVLPGFRKPVTA
jgi:hypothetical protein